MKQIANIQILRGMAAFAVVAFHAQQNVRGNDLSDTMPDLLVGAFGVDLFFAISGFIMAYASTGLFGVEGGASLFLKRRIVRIAPLYWMITAIYTVYLLHVMRHHTDHIDLMVNFATSIGFVGYLSPMSKFGFPIYPPGWTLDYEMFFYLCFSASLALPRRGAVAILALFFASLVILNQSFDLPFWASHLASSQILEFVAGMLVAELYLAGLRLKPLACLALILVGVCGALYAAPSMDAWQNLRGLVWGPLAAATLAGVTLWPSQSSASAVRGLFEALGGASYSLYLVHLAVFAVFAEILHANAAARHIPGIIYFTLLIITSLAAAFALYRFVERPLTRKLSSRILPIPLAKTEADVDPVGLIPV
jgi:exopolysaccharide production protein ExoZ